MERSDPFPRGEGGSPSGLTEEEWRDLTGQRKSEEMRNFIGFRPNSSSVKIRFRSAEFCQLPPGGSGMRCRAGVISKGLPQKRRQALYLISDLRDHRQDHGIALGVLIEIAAQVIFDSGLDGLQHPGRLPWALVEIAWGCFR